MFEGEFIRERPLVKRLIKRRWDRIVDRGRSRLIPSKVKKYAEGVSKTTDLPVRTVLKSRGVKKYRDAVW